MKKKVAVIAVCMAFGITMAAGCGKAQEPVQEDAVTGQSQVEEPEAEPKEVVTEETTETEIEPARPTSLDDAIALAIFDYNLGHYSGGEVAGEGHILMDNEKAENGDIKCYVLEMFGYYEFQDGNFVMSSGTGVIPCVITLKLNENGEYDFVSLQEAEDGSGFVDSIKENFPEALWSRCITTEDDDRSELERQERAYAEEYLGEIGREDADVGEYADYEHPLLTDLGVSVDVSNLMLDVESGEGFENNCPFWVGEREVLEDNVRYTYKKEYDEKNKTIIYSKIQYDTGEVLESSTYSAKTGEKVE